jgi:hypothetical protein
VTRYEWEARPADGGVTVTGQMEAERPGQVLGALAADYEPGEWALMVTETYVPPEPIEPEPDADETPPEGE